jgi:serine/threonine-protein kinase HipA
MNEKTLVVCLYGQRLGLLQQTPTGKMVFTYDDGTTARLSLGMPLRTEPYDEIHTEAYFGGLLPESDMARLAIGKRYGINHNNTFSLLKAIGYDCAGAVSLHLPDADLPRVAQDTFPLTGKVLSERALHRHILELPRKPLFLGVEDLRLSLAGAQDKAAVCLINNSVSLPTDGCPTSHILKPMVQGLEGMVHNEYFCLKLAERLGLTVPKAEIRWAQETPYLLIERYDRIVSNDTVQRIHQEDFCQALGIVSAHKYQREGGPDFKACFDLLRETTQPAKDRNALAKRVVFNYLIGNMDAHGKNFSLLHQKDSTTTLAPVYDVVCTRIYPDLTRKMAMKIGGYYEADTIMPRHWQRLCQDTGYAYPALRTLIQTMSHNLVEAATSEKAKLQECGWFHPVIDPMLQFFESQCHQITRRFESGLQG